MFLCLLNVIILFSALTHFVTMYYGFWSILLVTICRAIIVRTKRIQSKIILPCDCLEIPVCLHDDMLDIAIL